MSHGRYFLLLFLLALTLSTSAQASLVWGNDYAYVASAPGEGKAVGLFTFTNTGTYPVKISGFKTSCSCTAAVAEKRMIAPGEKGEVVINFNTTGRRGLREAVVKVKTDDPAIPESVLKFRVLIQEVLELQPTFLLWTAEEPVAPKKISVKVTEGFPVKEVRAVAQEAGLVIRVDTVKAGREYDVWVTPPPKPASLKTKIQVSSDYPSEKVKPMTAHIRVR